MGTNSKIEWTHHTFNPWRGCTKVSAGCANCYAEAMSKRNPAVLGAWGKHGARAIAAESYWRQPIAWNKAAAQAGERRRVFCGSLMDIFEGEESMPAESWPLVQQARDRLWGAIEQTPHLDWLLLTKRPENAVALATYWAGGAWPDNVWLGTSVENQAAADARIPHLLRVPARVRFLSCEPLLGALDLTPYLTVPDCSSCGGMGTFRTSMSESACGVCGGYGLVRDKEAVIDWIIAGGESGANARPMHQRWVRSLRDQAQAAGVAFFFKQHGEWIGGGDWEYDTMEVLEKRSLWAGQSNDPDDLPTLHYRVGKKAAGRLLGDQEWNEVPA
jgi:protein gp37